LRAPRWRVLCEVCIFLAFAIFFLLYGVTPWLGGDGLGLVGADEPRYAQIAREMLVRFDSVRPLQERLAACVTPDRMHCTMHAFEGALKARLSACVTPYLYGRPWLEKPALYYWRAFPPPRLLSSWSRLSTCTCGDFAPVAISMPP
jgi:hypothetical protein